MKAPPQKIWSDAQLSEAIRQGPGAEAAMRYLMRECWPIARSYIQARKGDEDEAKDIFQEALTNLLIQVREGKYEGKGSLKNYLLAICRGMWHNRFKRESRLRDFGEQHDSISPDDPVLIYAQKEQKSLLNQILDQLRDKCRSVLQLWASGFAMKEISERNGYQSPQVAMNKKNRCLKELKQLLKDRPDIRKVIRDLYE